MADAATAVEGRATAADALRRYLDGEHRAIKERVRGRMTEEEFEPVSELPRDEYRQTVMRWMLRLAEEGETKILFPREYGGEGNIGGGVAGFEMLAHADLSLLVKCGVQFGLFGGAVQHLGNERHRSEYLPAIMTGELPGCFAMTESGHGSDVQRVRTTAKYDADADELVVHTPDESASKDYIGNAACHGRMAVVFAQLEVAGEGHGVHAVLVPLRDEQGQTLAGVTIEDCGQKLGLEGVDNGRIRFDHVRVPRGNLLDRYGRIDENGTYSSEFENPNRRFFTTIGTLIQGRVSVGGAAISATKSALTIAIRHALRRTQFGPPDSDEEALLLDYRVHQRRLLQPLATTYALHFAQEKLRGWLHEAFTTDDYPDRERRKLESFAAGVKLTATWHATATIQTCREACGGAGYMAENRFAALKADTDVFTTFEGDNTILLQLVARAILTDYRERFGDLGRLEMVRFVGAEMFETAVERTLARQLVGAVADALPTSDDEEDRIEDRDLQLELFRWREERLIASVARRLKRGIDAGGSSFDVFNECQDHVLETARAHVDRLILEAFADAVERCDDDSIRPLLDSLFDLHALTLLERDLGWFFTHGRMNIERSRSVTRAINRLCSELREHAGVLVDAFAIPDEALAAPIGLRNAPQAAASAARG
jgi:acyl-CoA oxidase